MSAFALLLVGELTLVAIRDEIDLIELLPAPAGAPVKPALVEAILG